VQAESQDAATKILGKDHPHLMRGGAPVMASIGGDHTSPSHNLATAHFTASNVVAPTQKPFSTPSAGISPLVVLASFPYTEPLGVCMRNIPS